MKKLLFTFFIGLSLISCGKLNDIAEEITKGEIKQEQNVAEKMENGVVVKVYDGDTITLEGKVKLRLYGIDAPELQQKDGKFSKETLYNKLYNKRIHYVPVSTDRYGRIVAKIYLNGEYINKYMLEQGAAWWYEEYAKNDTDLQSAFEAAKKNRIGIFKNYKIKRIWKRGMSSKWKEK